jgi:hypothetical protein
MDSSKRRYLLALRDRTDLAPAEQHELDMAAAVHGDGWWLSRQDLTWQEFARAVGEFRQTAGRWPTGVAEDAAERRLGLWLESTRYRSRRGTLGWTKARGEYLDEVAPGWRGDDDPKWRAIADQVAAFRRSAGVFPRGRTEDSAELRLGQWLNATRTHSARGTGGWTDARGVYLDEVAPGWRLDEDQRWRAIADSVAEFYREHGWWPRSTATDTGERRLGKWLVQTRMYANRSTNGWTPARGAYLDQIAPGWLGRA